MDPRLSQTFVQAAKEIGVVLGEREILLFAQYFSLLRLWNGKMNLISVRDDGEIVLKHFLDSLTPVPFLPHDEIRILDIGAGPGLPGIPMKIAVDAWQLSLLEASRKRTSFMKEAVRHLALKRTAVIHDRAENLTARKEYAGTFDVVISRATLKLPQLIDLSNYFLDSGGRMVAMKGVIPDDEAAEAVQVSEKTGLLLHETHTFALPPANTPRKIIIYKKIL